MEKLGKVIPAYPMPVSLVGSIVEGKPNFLTVAWFTMVSYNPPMMAVILGSNHFSNSGIKKNNAFSVCIPSEEMLEVTDYVGIKSGKDVDKSTLFKVFYGETKAPMIEECQICVECNLKKVETNGANEMFIGEIVNVYSKNKNPTLSSIKPILLSQPDTSYYSIGKALGKAWGVGKDYKQR